MSEETSGVGALCFKSPGTSASGALCFCSRQGEDNGKLVFKHPSIKISFKPFNWKCDRFSAYHVIFWDCVYLPDERQIRFNYVEQEDGFVTYLYTLRQPNCVIQIVARDSFQDDEKCILVENPSVEFRIEDFGVNGVLGAGHQALQITIENFEIKNFDVIQRDIVYGL